jgi:hypothetical protein
LICAFILLPVLPASGAGKTERENVRKPEDLAPEPVLRPGLVFTGVAGKLSNKDDSIQAALRDAARRLSFFYSVSGTALKREHIGAEILDYQVESEYQLQYDEDLNKFLDMLEFDPARDVFENNNAVFVVTRMPSELAMPAVRGHSLVRERPAWVETPPPMIDGFIAGVGFSTRFSSHKDTVIASYEDAVMEIIENIKSVVHGELTGYQDSYSAFGTEVTTDNTLTSRGTLRHFYVVESWTDPVNLSVWTLAVTSGGE